MRTIWFFNWNLRVFHVNGKHPMFPDNLAPESKTNKQTNKQSGCFLKDKLLDNQFVKELENLVKYWLNLCLTKL